MSDIKPQTLFSALSFLQPNLSKLSRDAKVGRSTLWRLANGSNVNKTTRKKLYRFIEKHVVKDAWERKVI